jgi:mannose-1-phosphate guanylyltransferase / phosphomannomutase
MRAVLMAGGSGTRLRPLTCDLPKPMVPVLNRPIAEHIINLLRRHNITEIIATLHYFPDIIRDYFQDGSRFGVQITYAVEEDHPLGTAGCVKNVAELLDDTFLVISGDSITDFDLTAAIEFHKAKQSCATLVLTSVPNPLEFGVVITDEKNRIQRFLEKPSSSEIFSDTVNTGMYILEPETLNYLPYNQECDFSKDLFPLLLERNDPMYGYIASGYWCDVGHLEAYRQVQYAALERQVKLEVDYSETSPGVWIGQNTQIDPTVHIEAPALIGHHCRIGARTQIAGGTVMGDNVLVGADADLKRPIIWNGAILGEEVHLRGCITARGTRVDRRASVLEGSVVGSLTIVGEESQVSPNVRVWPSKRIDPGAILNMNLIWGQSARRNLFGLRGVSGLSNIDITPEFIVRLGAAFGSTLKSGSYITLSRDQRSISHMVTRSLSAGLMSVGINVQNLESTAIPVARSVVPTLSVAGGVHVRVHPERSDHILIEFFDSKGINLSKAKEKQIESAYFKEDFRRSQLEDIGNVFTLSQANDIYSNSFERYLSREAMQRSKAKIVIDYAYAVSGAVLPLILGRLGCDAVVLNASLRQTIPSLHDREVLLSQLGHVVEALHANMGVQVSANGEQFILVDESGNSIRGEMLTALMAEMVLSDRPRSTIIVPVNASSAIEQIARRHDSTVIRTKANPTALMETCHTNPHVVMGGSGEMGFIFPQLHPGFDAMFCIAKLIELLSLQQRDLYSLSPRTLGQIRIELPRVSHRSLTVRCPWSAKGALMRRLVESHPAECLDLTDGVKILNAHNESWILVLPDPSDPSVHLYADSSDRHWVEETLREYRMYVQNFVEEEEQLVNRIAESY